MIAEYVYFDDWVAIDIYFGPKLLIGGKILSKHEKRVLTDFWLILKFCETKIERAHRGEHILSNTVWSFCSHNGNLE